MPTLFNRHETGRNKHLFPYPQVTPITIQGFSAVGAIKLVVTFTPDNIMALNRCQGMRCTSTNETKQNCKPHLAVFTDFENQVLRSIAFVATAFFAVTLCNIKTMYTTL